MSEYQYYDFRVVDHPLNRQQMGELREISSRASIGPMHMTVAYDWGDFKGNPLKLVKNYFDAFLYYANWGEKRLILRMPPQAVDAKAIEQYITGESVRIHKTDAHLILAIEPGGEASEREPEVDEASLLPTLLTLREDLIRGDYRCLYLAWLMCAGMLECDDDEVEPPVPAGLSALTPALQTLVDFFKVNPHLIEVAARTSVALTPSRMTRTQLEAWVRALPTAEKDALVVGVLDGNGAGQTAALRHRFVRELAPAAPSSSVTLRTVGELVAAAADLAEKKERIAAEKAAQKRAEKERREALARAQFLDSLATRAEVEWKKIDALIATKRPNDYDVAVESLVDLRDLAARDGGQNAFLARLQDLRMRHSSKPSLLRRMDAARLTETPIAIVNA